jgi:hypothetical protein
VTIVDGGDDRGRGDWANGGGGCEQRDRRIVVHQREDAMIGRRDLRVERRQEGE